MTGLKRAWRLWGRRQWPLALVLLALLAGDLESMKGLAIAGRWWMVPGVALVSGLAFAASRWPVGASVGVCVVLLVWSAVLRLVGAQTLAIVGPLLATEAGALMAVVVVVVRRARAGAAVGVLGLLLAACVGAQVLRPRVGAGSTSLLWDVVLPGVLPLGLCVVAGWYLRGRDGEQARAMRVTVAAARQRERVSLARELHDVVAHHVGVMVVQAQAAQAVAGTDPGAAARVLPTIEAAGGDALAAMRRLVAALRDSDPGGGENGALPTQTTDLVADLRAVTATPHGGGTPVQLAVELAEPVPAEVATSVMRLVQESVTNARRHATTAREIAVSVRTGQGIVEVRVRDDGRPAGEPDAHGGGYGLIGMRERVQLLGGRFSAGRTAGGGWQVTAEVPLRVGAVEHAGLDRR